MNGWKRVTNGEQLRQQSGRFMGNGETEQIPDLARRDDHRDAGGKSDGDRERNVFDVSSGTQEPHSNKYEFRYHRCERQPIVAVSFDDTGDEADERARRSTDLETAPANERYDEPAGNCRVEAALRRNAGRDRDGHR